MTSPVAGVLGRKEVARIILLAAVFLGIPGQSKIEKIMLSNESEQSEMHGRLQEAGKYWVLQAVLGNRH